MTKITARRTRTRIATGIAAAALAFTAAHAAAPAAYAYVESVTAGSTTVYAHAPDAKTGAVKGVSYDASSMTLTLDNAKLSSGSGAVIAIDAVPDEMVRIKLKGSSTLKSTGSATVAIRSTCGVSLEGGTLAISGGSVGIQAEEVYLSKGTYRIKQCTKAGIVGASGVWVLDRAGTVSVAATRGSASSIVSTRGLVDTAPKRLKGIKGCLGTGASFLHANSLYRVCGASAVALERYGGTAKAALTTKRFGSASYKVARVKSRAFSTSRGKKVTRVRIGSQVEHIEAQAFKGTSALVDLDIAGWYGRLSGSRAADVASRAFAGCGKGGGAKLKVHLGKRTLLARVKVKAALVKKGLSPTASVGK